MSDPVRTVNIRYDRGALSIIGSAYLGTTADNAVDRIQLSNTPAGATATLVYGISIRSDGRLVVPEQELGDDESVLVNADVMRACTSGALPVRLRLDWTETGADGNPVTRRVMTEPVTLEVRPASPGSDTSRPETLTAAMTRISSWAWVETLTYKAGSIVAHGGRAWTSMQASNRGHEPVLGSEWWATFDADEETLAGLRDAISAEASAREAGDGAVKDAVYTSLSTEAADRQSADGKLREDLDAEISARTAAVSDEASLRDAGDAALSARITAEQAERSAADTAEATTRASADDALRASIGDNASAISAETSARESAVSAEASARAAAVSDETAARASADTALQTAVDGKAPISHASAGTEYGVGSATQYGHVRVDTALSSTSTNPVQNKVVQSALATKQGTLTWDTAPTAGSANPVTSGGVKTAIDAEASARASAVSSEASARANADSAETSARESADTALGARIDALGSASGKDVGTSSGQVPILGSDGKLDNSVIPALAISQYLGVVASAGALTGLTGQKGDYAVVSGTSATSGTYIISDNDGSSASDWVRISGPTDITAGDGIVVSGAVVGLASSGVTAGSKGSSVQIPTVTVDQYGRVTALGGATVYPPTTAGTSGQVWRSDGSGAGAWETPDTAPTANSAHLILSKGVKSAVDAEASARTSADSALQASIDAEAQARADADTALQSAVDAEASARSGAVSDEASARAAADAALQTAVDGRQLPVKAGTDISIGTDGRTINASAQRPVAGAGIAVSGRTVALASSGATAGTYGGASAIPQLTVDAYGRITKAATVAPAAQTPTAGTGIAVSGRAVSLADSGVKAGTYGSSLAVPRLVIDAHGRVTGASTQAIYPPTTPGTAGQLWQSDGSGQGVWQTLDTAPAADSVKAVTSGGVKAAIDAEASARASAVSAEAMARQDADSALQGTVSGKAAKTEALGTGTALALSGGNGVRVLQLTRKTVSGALSGSTVAIPIASPTESGLMTPAHVSKLAGLADPLSMADIVDKIYPVGSIYTSTSSTNPSTLFGGGAWVPFGAGRVLMGAGDSSYPAGSTGGEAAHQLTEREMPSHRHYIDNPVHKIAGVYNPRDHHVADSDNVGYGYVEGQGSRWDGTDRYYWYTWQESGQTNDVGGSIAHNNLQPYIVVYMWARTA